MELREALRLGSAPCLALVGAGGKTSALFQLAGEYASPVILAASAHLSLEQVQAASSFRHHHVSSVDELRALQGRLKEGAHIIAGPVEGERASGLSMESLSWLDGYCRENAIPLLVQAGGSRVLPMKALAAHEPPIPGFVREVVVVAGLSALGKPIDSAWVHRPEIFASVCGCSLEEPMTSQAIASVLTQPLGGIKNILPQARRVVLLNQADTPSRVSAALEMVPLLLQSYHAVIISALKPAGRCAGASGGEKLREDRAVDLVHSVHEPVAAIILAAGEGKRYGRPKQLLQWRGKPFVWQAANSALKAGLRPVIVVSGAYLGAVDQAVSGLPVQVVPNEAWANGQGTSVAAGVKALPGETGAAVFLLADQPHVPASLIQRLVEEHARTLAPVVVPWVEQQRANPVLFDRDLFGELSQLEGEVGGRQFFSRANVLKVPWEDRTILLDVDTPADYEQLLGIDDEGLSS